VKEFSSSYAYLIFTNLSIFRFRNHQNNRPKFIHEKMYSLIPDIQDNSGDGLVPLTPKAEKATPVKGSGKAYDVLASVGDSQPSVRQSDCIRARLNPSMKPQPSPECPWLALIRKKYKRR
jgi:hypothetical protein